MTYLDHVLELRRSIAGVGEAMSHRAWETAAGYIHTARSVPQEILEGSFALAMVPTSDYPDAPAVTLELATGELTQIFVRDFKQATESKDMPNVTRYFKLFPLIGQETAGLDIYSRFISGIISDQSRQLMTTTTTNQHDAAMFYAVATSRLFENIATIAAQHAPVVSRHYGPGRMLYVIDKIQDQADLQGGLIIDTFWDQRGLDRILNDIRNYAFPYLVKSFTVAASGGTVTGHVGPSRTGTPMLNDDEFGVTTPMANNAEDAQYLKSIGGLINETTVMLNRWMLYCKFLALHWPEYAGDKANNTDNDNKFNNNNNDSITLIIPKLIKESNYAKKISTKLAPFYDTLMTFFFRRSVEKAFQLDDAPPQNQDYTVESPLVTSVVDDVMYIFSSMMHQSLSTGDLALVRVTLGNIRRVLESDYIGLLQRRLRDGNPRNMVLENVNLITFRNGSTHGRFAGISLSDESKLRKFLINMNNLAVTGNYIDRILLNVMGDLGDKLPFSDDASQVSRTLDALAKSVKARA
ncbi:COG4-domain-containing protein, partial [Nadsonia fulvescens var. elongata DSM 6958]